ncbi:MAG TPA: T9SS type A sorting domain-containing protein [Flavobacteriales bacterium]|nr:T9SS type A sorting domain-containing protein [Flavobacteriales bacterium]HMR25958.1 T9SS type A sorting domain-containing protein [Flavobacteriales bacterium]
MKAHPYRSAMIGVCLLGCGPSLMHAQNWGKLGDGLRPSARTIFADSVFDRLLVGGSFRYVVNGPDTIDVMGIAAWDGQHWDSLATRIQTVEFDWQIWVGPVLRFMRYKGQLYASGYISTLLPDSTYLSRVGRLNENTMIWEPLECDFYDGGIAFLNSIVDDTLLFTGTMTQFCDTFPETCVVQYDGEHFRPFEPYYSLPYNDDNIVNILFRYNGYTYIGGLLTTNTNPLEYFDILRYTGSEWEPMPGFTNQGNITSALVHDGKLYIAGHFRKYQGAPGNCIAMYDGTTWNDLGGGMLMDLNDPSVLYPVVTQIAMVNGELVAVGDFEYAGDAPARNIAKWTGDRWCGYGGYFDQDIEGMAVWHDTLYVAGSFSTIDGQHVGHVARWDGGTYTETCSTPVGIADRPWSFLELRVHPNPSSEHITVQLPSMVAPRGVLMITDAIGRVVHRQTSINPITTIPVSNLEIGTYVLAYTGPDGAVVFERFIKQ